MDVAHIIISFVAGVAGGFIGAVTGGAGLLSIPALIFLGLPANQAIATNALASIGMIAGGVPEYQRAKQVRWHAVLKLIPLTILGGFIGSKTLVHFNADALSVVIGILLLLIVPIIFLNPKKGLKTFRPGISRIIIGSFFYFVIAIYAGFFGAGAGIFSTYSLTYFFGMTYIQAKASNFIPSFFLTVTAFAVFLTHGLINWELGIPMTIGMYLGGILGAWTALKNGNAWVRLIFVAVIVASGVKLIFFP